MMNQHKSSVRKQNLNNKSFKVFIKKLKRSLNFNMEKEMGTMKYKVTFMS